MLRVAKNCGKEIASLQSEVNSLNKREVGVEKNEWGREDWGGGKSEHCCAVGLAYVRVWVRTFNPFEPVSLLPKQLQRVMDTEPMLGRRRLQKD